MEEAVRQGYTVRALVRTPSKASKFPSQVEVTSGDVTRPETLAAVVTRVHAIVFALGSYGQGKFGAETVDYGGVGNILRALGLQKSRISLMTSIGVTNRDGSYNRSTEAHDWKRRSERLVRASGPPYTIVRPGWFAYNGDNEHKFLFLQGDRRQTSDPSDGLIARRQIAEVLVRGLALEAAIGKTFELVAATGAAQEKLGPLFAALDEDHPDALDAAQDMPNQPLEKEPQHIQDDLRSLSAHWR